MHSHPEGLAHDLDTLALQALTRRRRALRLIGSLGAAALLPIAGCGGGGSSGTDDASTSGTTSGTTTSGSGSTTCSVIPEETAGPYPGDGSNSSSGGLANALALSGIVRSDIRSSVDGASGTAEGVPVKLTIALTNTNASCASLEGYAIYLWHCNRDGEYSMYSSAIADENYLRGVQATDANGEAVFTTIFPACYSGRWPHMHFEVYRSLSTATGYANKLWISQLAMPEDVCDVVYADASGYSASVNNLAQVSLATDNVFGDGATLEQLSSISGSVSAGYVAAATVSIAA